MGKSQDQVRRWQNPWKKAVANFAAIVGDAALKDLTQDNMLDFPDWWWERIKPEGLSSALGCKDFAYITNIFRPINMVKRLSLRLPLSGMAFKSAEKVTRPPFPTAWVKEKLRPCADVGFERLHERGGFVKTCKGWRNKGTPASTAPYSCAGAFGLFALAFP